MERRNSLSGIAGSGTPRGGSGAQGDDSLTQLFYNAKSPGENEEVDSPKPPRPGTGTSGQAASPAMKPS